MKQLVLITLEKTVGEIYLPYLQQFFIKHAEIRLTCYSDNYIPVIENADVVLVTNELLLGKVQPYVSPNTKIVFTNFAFHRAQLDQLRSIPSHSRVLVFDYHYPSTIALVNLLRQFRGDQLEFIPYWRGKLKAPAPDEVDYIITQSTLNELPLSDKPVIDIGRRKLDVATLTNIASALGSNNAEFYTQLLTYGADLLPVYHGGAKPLGPMNQLNAVMTGIDAGVIIADMKNQKVISCNRNICSILSQKRDCFAFHAENCLPFCQQLIQMENTENFTTTLADDTIRKTVVVSKQTLVMNRDISLCIIVVRDAQRIHNAEYSLRKKQMKSQHLAKYHFSDIIHGSLQMDMVISQAEKIAKIDAPVLILGETGTGKEMFAQAIHNASPRRNSPFIAINCAALSDNLLESELFGYEEGSFTGAKRGGKTGLFEVAHGGTIFLDELGNISTLMQMKLLRVLQEKEIMRIGGTELIPIDVRIISATNSDIEKQVEEGTFRRDLYYRLNNFSLTLPPLREREEDVELLLRQFLASRGKLFHPEKAVLQYLSDYRWPGNVRELLNCAEYLAYMSGDTISMSDLPSYILNKKSESANTDTGSEQSKLQNNILRLCRKSSMGRVKLLESLHQQGYDITEYHLREILTEMQQDGLISISRGRGGIKVNKF